MHNRTLSMCVAVALAASAGLCATADAAPAGLSQGRGLLTVTAVSADVGEVRIYGPIGPDYWSYDGGTNTHAAVERQIRTLNVGTIKVYIASNGGVVDDGVGIHNVLRAHAARKVGIIESIAASIASAVACACDEVQIYPSAQIMIHGPSSAMYGDEQDMRDAADALASYKRAMAPIYARKTGRPEAEFIAMFDSRRDHYFTAAEAVELGIADTIITDSAAPAPADDATAAAQMTAYARVLHSAPATALPALRQHLVTACAARTPAFARLASDYQSAVLAHIEDPQMRSRLIATADPGGAPAPAQTPSVQPATVTAPAPTPVLNPVAELQARNTRITGVFAHVIARPGVAELQAQCLADVSMTVEAAQTRLLQHIGAGSTPLAGGGWGQNGPVAGQDERDKQIEAASNALIARAASGYLPAGEADRLRQGNPYASRTLMQLAESFGQRAGLDVRAMDNMQLARAMLSPRAQQSTADFPILLESAINRVLRIGYSIAPVTWNRFCAIGSVPDLKANSRYNWGSFSDLELRKESGEFTSGTLSDGDKETITADVRGRILRITPEVLINDDLQVFSRAPISLGQAASRTIEKRVFALLTSNSGAGPTMNDTVALFHSSRGNIASVSAAPSTASFDAARTALRGRMEPGGNDYLDVMPAIWLGPVALRGAAAVVNEGEFDHDSTKLQKPNISRNMVRDLVDSPRITGTRWYVFADPNIEPVIEVAFLNGVQQPRLVQEESFTTGGLSWRVDQIAGVAAVGHRGAYTNPGA